MKIALAQITTDPGALAANQAKILQSISDARAQGAELVVFPELTVNGYCHMDLAYNEAYIASGKAVLESVRAASEGIRVAIGYIEQLPSEESAGGKPHLRNALAVIEDGKILTTIYKRLLPQYNVFNERRYFEPGDGPIDLTTLGGKRIAFGICEDFVGVGYGEQAHFRRELYRQQPDLIVTINASPFFIGKFRETRLPALQRAAKEAQATVIYTNLVGSFDNYDGELVFDGKSCIVHPDGNLSALAAKFAEELLLIDLSEPHKIEVPPFDPVADAHGALVLGISEFFRRHRLKHAFIGLSGGVDSALVATLAVEALGQENVTGVTMPSHITSEETLSDAHLIAENLGITLHTRPINTEYTAWLKDFSRQHSDREPSGIAKQNKQARIRGSILLEYTNDQSASVVLTTGNKTELGLGYCTLYGDMVGALAPLGDVDKLLVYELARRVNSQAGREIIPNSTIERPPTAELEENQTDEESLQAPYSVLAPLVNAVIEQDLSRETLQKDYDPQVVDRVLRLVDSNEGKRRQAPPAIRIRCGALGLETRMPMGSGYRARSQQMIS